MFKERDIHEQPHWSERGATHGWYPKISDITPGSSVGLETDEGDKVKINVTKNDAGNFAGSVVDTQPDPPQSKRLAELGEDTEVTFGEANLIIVFSVPKQPIA